MADPQTETPDPDEVGAFAFGVWQHKQGEMVSVLIHLGDKLGLYRAMHGRGAMTAEEVANAAECHPRWVLEWLRGQAAAGLVDYTEGADGADDHYTLTPVGSAVLVEEETSLAFAAGAFAEVISSDVVGRLADAFKTGVGLSYDELGPAGAHRTERMLGPWIRLALVPTILPALDGVVERLREGTTVADIGCGSGLSLVALAREFPHSTFHGYDPSGNALDRARAKVIGEGLQNVELHLASAEEVPAGSDFGFIMTLDCLHDMTGPADAMASIRAAIADDGTWLIKDIRSKPRFSDNMKNPMLAMMYGFSVTACLSSAMSVPGGAGLGTLGLHPELAEEMVRAAGFSTFVSHDLEDPSNLYYEARP